MKVYECGKYQILEMLQNIKRFCKVQKLDAKKFKQLKNWKYETFYKIQQICQNEKNDKMGKFD